MEQHPIPQDITGFKFKLVGDMTLRQFGYLAAGLVLGWIIYSTPWYPFIRLPIAGLLAFMGVAFAFIPIEDRPLDIWVVNFFKAIYKPTFLVWQKSGTENSLSSPLLAGKITGPGGFHFPQLWQFPKVNLSPPKTPAPPKREVPQATPTTPLPPETPQPAETVSKPLSIAELEKLREQKISELAQKQQQLDAAKQQVKEDTFQLQVNDSKKIDIPALEKLRQQALLPRDPETAKAISQYDEQLKDLITENNRLISHIEELSQQMTALGNQNKTVLEKNLAELVDSKNKVAVQISDLQQTLNQLRLTPPLEELPKPKNLSPVRIVTRVDRPIQTISLSDLPNIISGLIKDDHGTPLPSVIVLVKDKAGSPLRALKSNKIGQFITNTPLENGTYYLEMEKEGWKFDTLEITLSGEVIPLIEIVGKANGSI